MEGGLFFVHMGDSYLLVLALGFLSIPIGLGLGF